MVGLAQCVECTRVGEGEADLLSERGEQLALPATACALLVRLGYQEAGGLAADDDPLDEPRLLLRAVVVLRVRNADANRRIRPKTDSNNRVDKSLDGGAGTRN